VHGDGVDGRIDIGGIGAAGDGSENSLVRDILAAGYSAGDAERLADKFRLVMPGLAKANSSNSAALAVSEHSATRENRSTCEPLTLWSIVEGRQ
jgi:hypothetical protein